MSNLIAYYSVSFFIVDSFYVHSQYLKHHVAAVAAWILTAYHMEWSLIHGTFVISFFELGALCVQGSRFFPNNLFYRTFFCIGYTVSRIFLTYYILLIFYTTFYVYQPPIAFYSNVVIDVLLVFLLILNYKWTFSQWKMLFKLYSSKPARAEAVDFWTFHQSIIGNTSSKQTVQ